MITEQLLCFEKNVINIKGINVFNHITDFFRKPSSPGLLFFLPTKKQLEFFSMSVGGKNLDYTIHGVPSCTCYLDFA